MFFNLLIVSCGLYFQNVGLDEANVSFETTHMGVLKVEGRFHEIEAEMLKVSAKEWRVKGQIDVTSIDTDNDSRDETILTEQYLNADAYPVIAFEARMLKEGNEVQLIVDLEIRGIQTQLIGELKEENGKLVSDPLVIDRDEIGLDFGLMNSLIGDEISVVINSGIGLSDLNW